MIVGLLTSACASLQAKPAEPPPVCTSAPVCKGLGLVRPSRSKDKIGSPVTADRIAKNNTAIEAGCVE